MPTLPIPRSPQTNSAAVAQLSANKYQKAALKPSMSASGLSFSWYREWSVMLAAITPLVASPTLLPICATVLKTPPASPCVRAGLRNVSFTIDATRMWRYVQHRGNDQTRNCVENVRADWVEKRSWERAGPIRPLWLDDAHKQCANGSEKDANMDGMVSAHSVGYQSHCDVGQCTSNRCGKEAN
jgi:hypothetical protein